MGAQRAHLLLRDLQRAHQLQLLGVAQLVPAHQRLEGLQAVAGCTAGGVWAGDGLTWLKCAAGARSGRRQCAPLRPPGRACRALRCARRSRRADGMAAAVSWRPERAGRTRLDVEGVCLERCAIPRDGTGKVVLRIVHMAAKRAVVVALGEGRAGGLRGWRMSGREGNCAALQLPIWPAGTGPRLLRDTRP